MQSTQNLRAFQELQFELQNKICSLNLPKLGPEFVNLAFNDCADALIAHRLVKKLSRIEASSTRARNSVEQMLDYDRNGLISFQPGGDSSCDPFIKWQIYHIRPRFHEILKNFRIDYQDFNFPSGESLDPSCGDVSLYAKLRSKKHWCVTRDCCEHFIRLVYSNLWFKRAAMYHIKRDPFYVKHKRRIDAYLWNVHKYDNDPAYSIFRVKMKEFVLTLVPGARLATVPKDNARDRVIEIESMGNMCVQRAIAQSIIKVIEKHFGYTLTDAQELHGQLISDHNNATVDFSNASNSNWVSLLEFYFPPKFLKLLKDCRSQVVSYRGEYFPLNMIAPMGNGFTFEVMSLFLLTIAREFDSHASVFGDDVVIDGDTAPSFIAFMEYHGWQVNEAKSFVSGHFRESCGYFHHSDGYITSYDWWLAEDEVDMMICINKILVLLDHVSDSRLHSTMKEFWNNAISLLHARSYRDISKSRLFVDKRLVWHKPFGMKEADYSVVNVKHPLQIDQTVVTPLDKGVLVPRGYYRRLTKILPKSSVIAYKRLKKRYITIAKNFNYTQYDVCVYPEKDYADHLHRAPLSDVRNKFWLATYFRFGRVVQPKSGVSLIRNIKILIADIDIRV